MRVEGDGPLVDADDKTGSVESSVANQDQDSR